MKKRQGTIKRKKKRGEEKRPAKQWKEGKAKSEGSNFTKYSHLVSITAHFDAIFKHLFKNAVRGAFSYSN